MSQLFCVSVVGLDISGFSTFGVCFSSFFDFSFSAVFVGNNDKTACSIDCIYSQILFIGTFFIFSNHSISS
ncbi:MAG: hypothetical protein LBU14_05070 [Candidatus Peribacteria bacterium]|nr:hypothetical protein [Candidatus Peribacteria bacterium]